MLPLNQIATYEHRGPATFITCNYCKQKLRLNFNHAAGYGFVGGIELGSGHLDDCDAVLAGITVDFDKEQRRKFVASHSKLEVLFYDLIWQDLFERWREQDRQAAILMCGGEEQYEALKNELNNIDKK